MFVSTARIMISRRTTNAGRAVQSGCSITTVQTAASISEPMEDPPNRTMTERRPCPAWKNCSSRIEASKLLRIQSKCGQFASCTHSLCRGYVSKAKRILARHRIMPTSHLLPTSLHPGGPRIHRTRHHETELIRLIWCRLALRPPNRIIAPLETPKVEEDAQ